jgi:hypothetical protein
MERTLRLRLADDGATHRLQVQLGLLGRGCESLDGRRPSHQGTIRNACTPQRTTPHGTYRMAARCGIGRK